MNQERFKSNTCHSFFGGFVYEQVIPKDGFLVQLRHVVPWQHFTHKLVKYYRGRAKLGRPPSDPAAVLKMLLLSYLYDLAECQLEDLCSLY